MRWRILTAVITAAVVTAAVSLLFRGVVGEPDSDATPDSLAYQQLQEELKESRARQVALENEFAELQRVLRGLASELKALRSELRGMAAWPEASDGAFNIAEDSASVESLPELCDPLDPGKSIDDRMAELRAQENEERMARHDAVHVEEQVDRAWARQIAASITVRFEDLSLPDSRIADIDCRATRCRVVIDHQDEAAHREFLEALTSSASLAPELPRAAFSHFEREDGSAETVVFLYQHSIHSHP
jgi:predicted  nucleic acid-binding Zn-ribbon protein